MLVSGNMTDKPEVGERLIAPTVVAQLLGVTTRTIDRMAKRGDLNAVTLPSGHRRYLRSEVEALAKPVRR